MDTKEYLKQLIDHYDHLLSLKHQKSFICDLHSFIEDLRQSCIVKLNKIKEADTEALIMANASAYHFLHTKND